MNNALNIVILDQSAFYPTSGGQANDLGTLTLGDVVYKVIDVEKVGHCVLHVLDTAISDRESVLNQKVVGEIDMERRR